MGNRVKLKQPHSGQLCHNQVFNTFIVTSIIPITTLIINYVPILAIMLFCSNIIECSMEIGLDWLHFGTIQPGMQDNETQLPFQNHCLEFYRFFSTETAVGASMGAGPLIV